MTNPNGLPFTKMHGLGNDYVYVNGFSHRIDDPATLAIKLSDRHFGIGSDGLVLIEPSVTADAKMRMFNADGSEAQMCGNAVRCIGKYLFEKEIIKKPTLDLETKGGVKKLELQLDSEGHHVEEVRVDMGIPSFSPDAIPVNCNRDEVLSLSLEVDGQKLTLSCVSVGNPHAICFVDEITDYHVHTLGPLVETHALFPERLTLSSLRLLIETT